MTRRLIVTAAVKTIRMIITITMMIAPLGTSIHDLTIIVYMISIVRSIIVVMYYIWK